jgi:hypothetical protein
MELKWQKTTSPPSVGLMNPKPRGVHLEAWPCRRLLLSIFLFLLKSLPAPPAVREFVFIDIRELRQSVMIKLYI